MLDAKIYTLLKVSETGNYTHAASALNLSQPAVSQHIHMLEEELHIKIFERIGTHLLLTHEGEKAIQCARSMLALYQKLEEQLHDEAAGLTGFTAGITHTMETERIAEVFARYTALNPDAHIKLITDTQAKLLEMLKNYEVDFILIDGTFADEGLVRIPLDTDRLVLIVHPDHPLSSRNMVTAEEIKKEKLILRLSDNDTRDLFSATLESCHVAPEELNIILEMDNVAMIKELVAQGYGVSILAQSACRSEVQEKKLTALPVACLRMNREISLVCRKGFAHKTILEKIIAIYNA